MKPVLNRRQLLSSSVAVAGWAMCGTVRRAMAAAPQAELVETKVISVQPEYYHGWPTLARRKNGQLLAVCSGGREEHVCPFGRVELMRSNDGGQTWGWPCVVMDCEIDDRDAGVLETDKGTLLITSFTSLAYETSLERAEKNTKTGGENAWPQERLLRWRAAHNRLNVDQRKALLGSWMIRSTDGGLTWSRRYDSYVNSPHGPIQLSDSRLLYPGKALWKKESVGVSESTDDGQTWRWLAAIPAREGDDPKNYHELHGVETADGRILVQIRNHNQANAGETLQTESSDGGKTWEKPRSIGVWGLPSHLLRLRDGRLLMTYGYRRRPFGNQVRVSTDHGRNWSEAITLSGDGLGGDLGYPSTVALDDGTLVSLWYERLKQSPRAVLRQAKWKLQG